MFFRVRTSLHERPGALAALASHCGEAGLNILGLQIFPDLGRVTDELVISAPEDWTAAAVAELVSGAGGDEVSVEPCTTHDLIDQPTRWLSAAQDVLHDPAVLPEVLERLLGSAPERWSATEHSRVAALRALVEAASGSVGASGTPSPVAHAPVEYDETANGVLARIGGHVVGVAAFTGAELTIEVVPAWRRLGIGSALLSRACTQAASSGQAEAVLVAPAADEGFVSMVCGAGLRPRIKVSGGLLTARISLSSLADVRRPSGVPEEAGTFLRG